MATEPVNKLLLTMSLPLMISMATEALYNVVDTLFVSRIGEHAITALSLAFPVQLLVVSITVGTGVGVGALLSRLLGERNKRGVDSTAANGIFLAAVTYALFLIFGLFFTKRYYAAQTQDAVIYKYGVDYLSICMIWSFGAVGQIIFQRLLQSTGRTALSMISQLTGAAANIVLDPVLIFGLCGAPKLGVAGAAIATVLSQCVSFSILMSHFVFKRTVLRIGTRYVSRSPAFYGLIARTGMPTLFRQGMASLASIALNTSAAVYGDAALAAMAIVMRVSMFIGSILIGFGQGFQPVAGYNFGARRYDRVVEA